jgi:hypothetical protein
MDGVQPSLAHLCAPAPGCGGGGGGEMFIWGFGCAGEAHSGSPCMQRGGFWEHLRGRLDGEHGAWSVVLITPKHHVGVTWGLCDIREACSVGVLDSVGGWFG